MRRLIRDKAVLAHVALVALLFGLQFVLSDYQHLSLARVMVLAAYAAGYNILFGYAGLLSLGHAMFFAAGLYGAGLTAYHLGWQAPAAFVGGRCGRARASRSLVGLVALRTRGVAFMIVTMMFAQACYLTTLYFGAYTRGDEGFTVPEAARRFTALGISVDLASADVRYNLALALLAAAIAVTFVLVRAPAGRVLVAIRENEERTIMLGYDSFRYKLAALVLSGTIAAAAGAAYALLFAYVGATFASIQYSIYPLLWTLLGGAGTVAGPVRRHAADVPSGRRLQRIHLRLSARGRRRARAAHPVLPQGHHGDAARKIPAMAAVTLLSTRGLSRAFGGLKAVDDVDFDLAAGEVRAIIGPNGAGKTTFVSLICGRVAPTSGQIVFAGEDITSAAGASRASAAASSTRSRSPASSATSRSSTTSRSRRSGMPGADSAFARATSARPPCRDRSARAGRPRRPPQCAGVGARLRPSAAARSRHGPGARAEDC